MALRVDTPAWPPYFIGMLPRAAPPSGFIEPCLPSPAERPPTGPDWVHEIKHDGYRLMARRDPVSVGIRLLTRNGRLGVPLPAHCPGREPAQGALVLDSTARRYAATMTACRAWTTTAVCKLR
jgi:hypothetical protein